MKALACGLLAGCIPIASPPVHGKLGGGYATTALHDDDGIDDNNLGVLSIGLDSAVLAEGLVGGAGYVTDFDRDGVYAEAGVLGRLLPTVRFGGTAGAEAWLDDDQGFGVRAGATLDLATPFARTSSPRLSRTGAFAIGVFLDAGYRWREDEDNYAYLVFGLSIRLAAAIGHVRLR